MEKMKSNHHTYVILNIMFGEQYQVNPDCPFSLIALEDFFVLENTFLHILHIILK
jgi:hypothetical protein